MSTSKARLYYETTHLQETNTTYATTKKKHNIHKNLTSKKWNSSRARFKDRYGTKGMIN
ncbi:hypothetical protein [Formosa sp. S-31]|uniref:hypothetical protein n=1 Tax=Formosa sp. S-31 TaxID=2790949 RepID=UPI003EB6B9D2